MGVSAASGRRVLCIVGSPRRHGNSDHLADEFSAGVVEVGGECDRLSAYEAGIAPCRGCNACSSTGECVVRDGMDDVYPRLDSADAIAVITPVYFATVPAVLKALYDRCQPYWARRYVLHEPRPETKRPGGLILVGGGGDPFGTACAVTPTQSVFNVLSVSLDERYEAIGLDSPADVGRHPEALQAARAMGRSLGGEVASL